MDLRNKKVLLIGLGILGGGVATARWLMEHGAKLTVTDSKSEEELKKSLDELKGLNIKYTLGVHKKEDVLENEIIVVNPGVPADHELILFAGEQKKQIENELTLFLKLCKSRDVVAVTGTRGKTTTANWLQSFKKRV